MSYRKNFQSNQTSVFQRVTDYVIEALEKGVVPWQRKWNSYGLPRNITTGHVYKGWNAVYLNCVTLSERYKTPFFLTFKQAIGMGGNIRKGEKGYPITYWEKIVTQYKAVKAGNKEGEDKEYPRSRMICKMYWVFNIEQTEKISFAYPAAVEKTPNERIEACETIVEQMPKCPPIRHGGGRAFYSPPLDFVQMPPFEEFESPEYYYCTLFHELGHSTGHDSRLNRKEVMESDGFGNYLYSKEELTAEFTAAFLCAFTGIERKTIDNSASYIDNWLHNLHNDKTLVLKASSQARTASDFILNMTVEQAESAEEQPVKEIVPAATAKHA